MTQTKPMAFLPSARILSRKEVYKDFRCLEVITLEARSLKHDGFAKPMVREVISGRVVASVIPYIPETDQILMLRQFRAGAFLADAVDPFLYETPAGFIDDGETAEEAAIREGLEETGADITALEYIGNCYTSPGMTNEDIRMFVGRIASAKTGIFGLDTESEEIETFLFPANDVFQMLDDGRITNATAALSLNWFARHRDRIRDKWMKS